MNLRANQTLLSTTGGAKSVATSAPVISREFHPASFNSIITFLSLSTEYAAGLADGQHPWEESRGMAHSYRTAALSRPSCPDSFFLTRSGHNRAESLSDYKTGEEFIFMLVDIVSRGGNLLLNIGPSGMQMRTLVHPSAVTRVLAQATEASRLSCSSALSR